MLDTLTRSHALFINNCKSIKGTDGNFMLAQDGMPMLCDEFSVYRSTAGHALMIALVNKMSERRRPKKNHTAATLYLSDCKSLKVKGATLTEK